MLEQQVRSPVRDYGRYQLIAEVGRGGMAEVYVAVTRASGFSKLVVIKKLREHLARDPEFVSMLLDEARIAGLLNHVNLVQTLEVGETNHEVYLAMEYLDGQPLHKITRAAGDALPLEIHLSVLADVLTGMEYAHNVTDLDGVPLDIVHRDLTPHNVFVTYQGVAKVVDFGIAKAAGRASETRHGVIKGKAAYMAPEQAMGLELDRRADIFSIGVMLYEAATRVRMWKGVSEVNVLCSLVSGHVPRSPKKFLPSVDDELDRICERALAPTPSDRYATAGEMERDLRAFMNSRAMRPSTSEVGAFVTKLFAERREITNKIIQRQLALVRESRPFAVKAAPESPSPNSSGSLDISRESSTTSLVHPANGGRSLARARISRAPKERLKAAPLPAHTPSPESRRFDPLWIAVVALAGLVAIVGTATLTLLWRSPNRERTRTSTDRAPSERVTLTLRATPLETRFSIDDGPPLENPYIGTFARDDHEHVIRATAPGYASDSETVVFHGDVSLRFALATGARGGK